MREAALVAVLGKWPTPQSPFSWRGHRGQTDALSPFCFSLILPRNEMKSLDSSCGAGKRGAEREPSLSSMSLEPPLRF